jgi:hypothetical protein
VVLVPDRRPGASSSVTVTEIAAMTAIAVPGPVCSATSPARGGADPLHSKRAG